ncbi:hypothetical protein BHE74_00029341 [Ensete ventricosum]|nr:hypothetical protein GW17_00062249 [Ensete ventricosum]RWW63473.1 hypothetical protein BHE74_00029341 [Ensete ventricosum]RZR79725.1 hypothetical protein BHM03_00005530 [Ensete ventricosum]
MGGSPAGLDKSTTEIAQIPRYKRFSHPAWAVKPLIAIRNTGYGGTIKSDSLLTYYLKITIKLTTKLNDLTPAFRQPLESPAMSLTVFLQRSPSVFLVSFPISSANLLANSERAPTASSNPWPNA